MPKLDVQTAEDQELTANERSALAGELSLLKQKAFGAISKRERVPHPLFWSLFLDKVADIRDRKSKRAMLTEILG